MICIALETSMKELCSGGVKRINLYYQRSLALHYREQYQAALKDISTAINLEPDHVSYYLSRSVICNMLKDMSGAKLNIKMAEELEKVSSKL
jgi:hypothetical protein